MQYDFPQYGILVDPLCCQTPHANGADIAGPNVSREAYSRCTFQQYCVTPVGQLLKNSAYLVVCTGAQPVGESQHHPQQRRVDCQGQFIPLSWRYWILPLHCLAEMFLLFQMTAGLELVWLLEVCT